MKDIPKRESMQSYMEEYSSPLITQPPTPDAVTSSAETDIGRKEEQEEQEDTALKESLDFLFKEEMKMFARRKKHPATESNQAVGSYLGSMLTGITYGDQGQQRIPNRIKQVQYSVAT